MAGKILLVEDEPNIVEAIRFVLSRDGWDVETHIDGATALDKITQIAPDVVILDVMLPNRSGFDVLRDMRGMEVHKDRPVLMLTARGQVKDRQLAASLGVSTYMTKPFSNAEMLDALHALVG